MLSKTVQNLGKSTLTLVSLVALIGIIVLIALHDQVPDVLSGIAIAAVSGLGGATIPMPANTDPPTSAGITDTTSGADMALRVAQALSSLGATMPHTSSQPAAVVTTVTTPAPATVPDGQVP